MTVAQRYPVEYDGILATVPVVSLSSLQVAPVRIRIHEKPEANWITPAKVNAIRGEFMRQCDKLDGLVDGIINNYMACRAIFDVSQPTPDRQPWAAKRCPNNIDPNPADTSNNACLTDGQISTLQRTYSRYPFKSALANGVMSFPNGFNRLDVLMDWVEKEVVPGKSLIVTAGEKSLPLCSYPAYPEYVGGPSGSASSYVCAAP